MHIDLTPEEESRLAALPRHEGTDTGAIMKAAVARRIEEQARCLAAGKEGIASADQGELIPHEEVASYPIVRFAAVRETERSAKASTNLRSIYRYIAFDGVEPAEKAM